MAEGELACSTDCGGGGGGGGSGGLETEADSGGMLPTTIDNNSAEEEADMEDSKDDGVVTNYDSSDGCPSASGGSNGLAASTSLSSHHRKMFECDICQMKFSNGANMRRHKMRHTGVKPYECRVCQKRFFRKDHLAEHFTTHTKTLPFHCPICNRGFQRQIAMRAHFQNEHVGQNDVVKSCPLCSYRAGSMKSLRVHFFNRHGIDLDRPTVVTDSTAGCGGGGSSGNGGSDSGDSARSVDNATPPMHFLTPHVEISMADPPPPSYSPTPQGQDPVIEGAVSGDSPGSPQSGDSNTPSSSGQPVATSGGPPQAEVSPITPSVSLIPIKQEAEEPTAGSDRKGPINLSGSRVSPLASLIKVSPLKSLLRDDLRGRPVGASSPGGGAQSRHPKLSTPEPPTSSALDPPGPPPPDSLWRPPLHHHVHSPAKFRLNCVFCGIGFPDQTLYFLHKGCHSESNPWKCNICGEQCCNVYDFNSHLLSKTHQ